MNLISHLVTCVLLRCSVLFVVTALSLNHLVINYGWVEGNHYMVTNNWQVDNNITYWLLCLSTFACLFLMCACCANEMDCVLKTKGNYELYKWVGGLVYFMLKLVGEIFYYTSGEAKTRVNKETIIYIPRTIRRACEFFSVISSIKYF